MSTSIPQHVNPQHVVDIDVYALPGTHDDYHTAWVNFLQSTPEDAKLVWTTRNGGHWIPVRADAILEIFGDHEHFSSRIAQVPRERGLRYRALPQTLDPPEHKAFRDLLAPTFSLKGLKELEPFVRTTAVLLVEGFKDRGSCEFMQEFCFELPIRVFMKLVDLPMNDAPMLKHWADEMVRPTYMTLEQVYEKFVEYLGPRLAARKGGQGTDLLTQFVNATIEGRPIRDDEVMNLATQVLFGGLDTVAAITGFVFRHLAGDAALCRRIVDEPARIPAVVDELIRRFPIAVAGRVLKDDYDFHGTRLRKDDIVSMPTMAFSFDQRSLPDTFDVKLDRPSARNATFGNGIHQCPGQALARLELRIALETWFARIPTFRIAPGAMITTSGGAVGLIKALPLEWDVG
jgi:cytochrome P450